MAGMDVSMTGLGPEVGLGFRTLNPSGIFMAGMDVSITGLGPEVEQWELWSHAAQEERVVSA
jgi:hypothetical protein